MSAVRSRWTIAFEADLTFQATLIVGVEHRNHAPRGATWGSWPLVFADGTQTDFPRGDTDGLEWTRWDLQMTTGYARLGSAFDNGWTASAALTRSIGACDSTLFDS